VDGEAHSAPAASEASEAALSAAAALRKGIALGAAWRGLLTELLDRGSEPVLVERTAEVLSAVISDSVALEALLQEEDAMAGLVHALSKAAASPGAKVQTSTCLL
jgi:hypothetical protein